MVNDRQLNVDWKRKTQMENWWKKLNFRRQEIGTSGELQALQFLKNKGLILLETNFQRPFGEIDIIMQDGVTLVFVEVRSRKNSDFGGAAASITTAKQHRLTLAALSYLKRFKEPPECRFDVIAIDGAEITWLKNVITA